MSGQQRRQRIIESGEGIELQCRSFCETGTLCLRTRDLGKATRSVHETGSLRKLLDLGSRLGARDVYSWRRDLIRGTLSSDGTRTVLHSFLTQSLKDADDVETSGVRA
jgi:hypothetical protein